MCSWFRLIIKPNQIRQYCLINPSQFGLVFSLYTYSLVFKPKIATNTKVHFNFKPNQTNKLLVWFGFLFRFNLVKLFFVVLVNPLILCSKKSWGNLLRKYGNVHCSSQCFHGVSTNSQPTTKTIHFLLHLQWRNPSLQLQQPPLLILSSVSTSS